jgi:outer membrane protein assembly factor BamB
MKRMTFSPTCTIILATFWGLRPAVASNWPQFRGPDASGASEESGLPEAWDTTKNVAWKTDIPGSGWSSPIVWGDRVFVTSVVSEGKGEKPKKGLYFGGERKEPPSDVQRWTVFCIDFRTGQILWQAVAHEGKAVQPKHIKNTYASETPVTDGQCVYAYFGNVGVFCYDFDGKPVWSQRFDPVKTRAGWGTAASPVLHEDRLFIINDNEEHSFLLALDKKTGKQIWRTDRDERSNWSTPLVWTNDLRTEIVTPGTGRVRSYDLDGKLLWEFRGMSKITIPTPQAKDGLVYISSGFVMDGLRPVYAVRPGASGDISLKDDQTGNSHIAWCSRRAAPYNPSPLVYGNYVYVLYDGGFLACFEAKTGKPVYDKQRIEARAGAFTSSPVAYEGKLLCLSEDGDGFVIQAGPEFKLLNRNGLDEMCLATPAIANGSLIIRTAGRLYRIANQPATKSP